MKQIGKYQIRTDLYYEPENHFWVDVSGGTAIVGMSPLIQETSGAFVAIQIENPGTELKKDESLGSVEAEKHVGKLKSPISGKVISINENILENPKLINDDPYGDGWLVEMTIDEADLDGLISGEEKITEWVESEIARFNEKGWLAQP